MMQERNTLTEKIIGAANKIHQELGPGWPESNYRDCLFDELIGRGLSVEKELDLPAVFKGQKFNVNYQIDLLVEKTVLVELKSVKKLLPDHEAQILSYLKLAGCKLGLLLNFNVPILKDGIKRYNLE